MAEAKRQAAEKRGRKGERLAALFLQAKGYLQEAWIKPARYQKINISNMISGASNTPNTRPTTTITAAPKTKPMTAATKPKASPTIPNISLKNISRQPMVVTSSYILTFILIYANILGGLQ